MKKLTDKIRSFLERRIDILIVLFCIFSFLILGQQFIGAQAQVLPIWVSADIDFGIVFPGEFLQKFFKVSLTDNSEGSVNYSIIQKTKPLIPGDSAYCQQNPTDYSRCYRNLCPFLTKTSQDGEGDTESSASVSPSDLEDNWIVGLQTPAIKGFVAQDHIGDVVDVNGIYGCDLSINVFAEGEARCGDGIKNGTEACDGIDGVPAGFHCTLQCTLEPNVGPNATIVSEGGGGGNGPIGPSDAYQNWLNQQLPPGQVKGEITQNPTGMGGGAGEVLGESIILPATGFDFNEFVILAMILLALIGLRVILKKKSATVA